MADGIRDAFITGLGIYLPEKVVTNKDLEEFLDTSDKWIRERTGICERRILADDLATSDMAIEAGKQAMEDAGVGPDDIDLIIVATFTEDHPFPATASIVQDKLGCKNAGAFDIQAACSSWVAAANTAAMWVKSGGADTVLLLGSDCPSRKVDWKDRATAVIFGDAAAGAVVQAGEKCGGKGFQMLSSYLGSDGSGLCHLYQPAGGSRKKTSPETVAAGEHYIRMEGRSTYKFAVKAFADSAAEACRRAGLDIRSDEVALIIPHQANARILEGAAKRLEVPEKIFINIDKYGNTVSASVGIALYEARAEGRIKPGDCAALVGMGAGLSWGGLAIRWVE